MTKRKKPNRYWREWRNYKTELKGAIKANNGVYNEVQFRKLGFMSLVFATSVYHGGKDRVLNKIGYQVRSIKHYKLWRNVKKDLVVIISKLNHFPSDNELRKIGYRNLSESFYRYHGGVRKVREKMGYLNSKKAKYYWEDFRNIEREIKKSIKENKGKFPSKRFLIKSGRSGIINNSKTYGGLNGLRKKMGYELSRRPKGYWEDFSNAERELWDAIRENGGVWPTQRDLKILNKSYLIEQIANNGGKYNFADRIGYNERKREELARELEQIILSAA